MDMEWGLLGPESLPRTRRNRTLGLGSTVRAFNNLAVPGLAGVWYGKQLLLTTLGIAVAEQARNEGFRVTNIEAANAIEALACRHAFNSNGWQRELRLRGRIKLQGKTDWSFKKVRQRNFYVVQPMRMAVGQALPALGFVRTDSSLFNAFSCSDSGQAFVQAATMEFRPYNGTVLNHLVKWVQGDLRVDTETLGNALSPLTPLSEDAKSLLRERLLQGGQESPEYRERRHNALAWVESLRNNLATKPTWQNRPNQITEQHWSELHAGAVFFMARKTALDLIDAVEAYLGNQNGTPCLSLQKGLPDTLNTGIDKLKAAASTYLELKYPNPEAGAFCSECTQDDSSSLLRALVARDGQVLRLVGDDIKPGPVFRGRPVQPGEDDADEESFLADDLSLPDGISYRVRNLYLLNLDIHGELDAWLMKTKPEGNEA
ncbi:hypothetical protein JKG47_11385 [Acidithiobacillus sp. MC6.1]|nr:hypothetical protein [Acidithiobacillus sp. MC6.1]